MEFVDPYVTCNNRTYIDFLDWFSTGVCRTIVKLAVGDEVYCRNHYTSAQKYHDYFTMFTGNIVKRD